jgi:hypothetical protein
MAEATAIPIKAEVEDIDVEATRVGIKVTILLPEIVDERVRQRKINEIYDILCPVEVS